jgi:hypothetical protein
MAVSSVSSYRGLVEGLTGAQVHFGRSAGADASLPARRYPTGRTRIALTFPAVPSSLCGATAADTRLNTIGLVARNVMANEASSPATARTVHRVARDPAFRRAVATRDPVALRAAIVGFFRDDLALRQLALAVRRAQRRSPREHDQQLLVGVVDVQREGRRAGRDLEERGSQVAAAGLPAQPRPPPSKRRRVALGVPVGLEDVGHARSLRNGRHGTSIDTSSRPVGKLVPVMPSAR